MYSLGDNTQVNNYIFAKAMLIYNIRHDCVNVNICVVIFTEAVLTIIFIKVALLVTLLFVSILAKVMCYNINIRINIIIFSDFVNIWCVVMLTLRSYLYEHIVLILLCKYLLFVLIYVFTYLRYINVIFINVIYSN